MRLVSLICAAFCAWSVTASAETNYPRIWQDGTGGLISLVQDDEGYILHLPKTGEFFRYEADANGLVPNLIHAPSLRLNQEGAFLNGMRLDPADLQIEEIEIRVKGASIHGRLTLPKGEGPHPLVINQAGSEHEGSTKLDWTPAWYAQAGFATFSFDKRGTGNSGGRFTHDFGQMAEDIRAIVDHLAKHPLIDANRIGLAGYSQGGYVVALAANEIEDVAFMISAYSMTESPVIEDLQETMALFDHHFPGEKWSDFEPLVRACGQAFALGRNHRWREVKRLKNEWRGRIDAAKLAGTLTGDGCLKYPPFILRIFGRSHFPEGLDWGFDPKPLIEKLDIPVLFAFGLSDHEAPSESSVQQVEEWISRGYEFDLRTYADADHGIFLSTVNNGGQSYRYKDPAYIEDIINWLKQQLERS